MMTNPQKPLLIAFYLPQFHPIPENDEWWGKGFTEWTNVTRARPKWPGHYQPHLPADLGFYDLRLPEVRHAQADLARKYGIGGFCYYHYWFDGKRLLERPVNEVIASGQPDFPFCLCWANEPWSRNWDGGNRQVLVAQHYSPEDDLAHIRALLPIFADRRYIRIDGKPLFLVYRASHLSNSRQTTDIWRSEASRQGLGELFLARVESNFEGESGDPIPLGFDAAVEFAPNLSFSYKQIRHSVLSRIANEIKHKLSYSGGVLAERLLEPVDSTLSSISRTHCAMRQNVIVKYSHVIASMLAKTQIPYERFPCVCPSWDNSARRKTRALILVDSDPLSYQTWLRSVIMRQRDVNKADRPIFINAWNEWAEGCHLEPCQKWGLGYLEATARAINE